MESLGLVELLKQTIPNLKTLNAWGRRVGSRGDRVANCALWGFQKSGNVHGETVRPLVLTYE